MNAAVRPSQVLLTDIEAFLVKAGMAESTFGRKVVNDGKLISRLRAGGSITLDSAETIRRFISTHPSAASAEAVA